MYCAGVAYNCLPPCPPPSPPAQGKGYSVNVPLMQGIDTEQYLALFKPIMRCVLLWGAISVG